MRKSLAFLLAAGLVIGLRALALALPAGIEASASATIDGETFTLSPVTTGKFVRVGSEDDPAIVGNSDTGQMRIFAIGNMDPVMVYMIEVIDFGAPSAFGFEFSMPIGAVGAPNFVRATIAGGLTDATGDGVSITPSAGALQVSSVGPPLTNMGVDVGLAAIFPRGDPGNSYGYGTFDSARQPGPGPGPWTMLMTGLDFSLSGGDDTAWLTGGAAIVPAPPAFLFLGAGLVGIAVACRRRTRRR